MRTRLVAVGTLCLLFSTFPASAARLDLVPSVSIEQEYDSNVFNTDGNEKEDFILHVTPAITLSLKMPETTLSLRTSITSDNYFRYTEQNTMAAAIFLAIGASPISLTPRLSVSPSGYFVRSQDSYRRTQLVPTGDPLVPTTIVAEDQAQTTRDYGGSLRATYLVTPKVDFSLGGGFTTRQYLDNVSASDSDSKVATGDATLAYRFTPVLSSGFFYNTSLNNYKQGVDSRVHSMGVAGAYRYSPSVSLSARAGVARTEESSPSGIDSTTWDPIGSLTMEYVVEDSRSPAQAKREFRSKLNLTVDQVGGGGYGLTTRRHAATFSIGDRYAPEWWLDLWARYEYNVSLDAAQSEDIRSATGTAGLAYQPAVWATFRLSGTAFRQWSYGTIGTDLVRYSAFLGITFGKEYNLY